MLFTQFPSTIAMVTTIYVDPPTTTIHDANTGETFTVNITIAEVVDLCVWEFKLYYDNTILSCINATEGPFLKAGGDTYFTSNITNTYNATHGRAHVGCTLTGIVPGVNGNGVLATITFQINAKGETPLNLDSTKLWDSSLPDPNPIDHNTIDGTVHVGIHDIAITNVFPSKTIVGQGYSINITVTVQNQGEFTETFNVTAYGNTTIINTLTNIMVTSGNSTTITFTWNTSGYAKGVYTISANATIAQGEIDLNDNTFTDGAVTVSCKGDITGPTPNVPDGTVNMRDISLVAKGFGANLVKDPASPKYGEYWHGTPCDQCPHSANCDLTGPTQGLPDDTINMRDISLVASLFGTGG